MQAGATAEPAATTGSHPICSYSPLSRFPRARIAYAASAIQTTATVLSGLVMTPLAMRKAMIATIRETMNVITFGVLSRIGLLPEIASDAPLAPSPPGASHRAIQGPFRNYNSPASRKSALAGWTRAASPAGQRLFSERRRASWMTPLALLMAPLRYRGQVR